MSFRIHLADEDDWAELRTFWASFRQGRYASRVDCNLAELRTYFRASTTLHQKVGVILGRWNGELYSAAVVMEIIQPVPQPDESADTRYGPNTFVLGIYTKRDAPRKMTLHMDLGIEEWGRQRNHLSIVANVRPWFEGDDRGQYPFGALKKLYGYVPWHVVVGRPIRYSVDSGRQSRYTGEEHSNLTVISEGSHGKRRIESTDHAGGQSTDEHHDTPDPDDAGAASDRLGSVECPIGDAEGEPGTVEPHPAGSVPPGELRRDSPPGSGTPWRCGIGGPL